jgi:2,3-bisphosphoglycerate-independent phosphoglycerate mutase
MVDENNIPLAQIEEDDVVIFFNFRTDRGRELTEVLTQMDCQTKHAQTQFVLCHAYQL